MDIITNNIEWMLMNIFLALLGIILGVAFISIKNKLLKVITFLVWIIYLPNTIYLVTDIQHFFAQWLKVEPALRWLLATQYIILIFLGILTYILGFYLLDKFLSQSKIKKNKTLIICLLILTNYLISFAVTLGKIDRLHSIEAIINPLNVISKSYALLSSSEIILAIFIFGTLINLLYFYFRGKIKIKI